MSEEQVGNTVLADGRLEEQPVHQPGEKPGDSSCDASGVPLESTAAPGEGTDNAPAADLSSEASETTEPENTEPENWDLPLDLQRLIEVRMQLWQRLLELDDKRSTISAGTREIRSEISRQNSELKKLPDEEKLKLARQKIAKFEESPPPLSEVQSEEADEEETNAAYARLLELHRRVAAMGATQCKLLTARHELDAVIPKAACTLSRDEPLAQACAGSSANPSVLLGWTYYCAGLSQLIQKNKRLEEAHLHLVTASKREFEEQRAGFIKKLRRNGKSEGPQLPELDPSITGQRRSAERELAAVEPMLSEMYWALYEELALLFTSGDFGPDQLPAIRAYLRYGLVASNPKLIDPEKSSAIMRSCREDLYDWQNTSEATHVLYADEYIQAIHDRKLSVSPDEELELNGRGSDLWKADRSWRLAVSAKSKNALYTKRYESLHADSEKQSEACAALQAQIESLKDDPDRREEMIGLKRKLAEIRPEAARAQQMAERLGERMIPNLEAMAGDAEAKLPEAEELLSMTAILKREVGFVRRMARLSARLKTPYSQFVLRDYFEPKRSDHHTRGALLDSIRKVEFADQGIFHEVVIPNKKRNRRLTIRMSPAVLIVPARGTMGLSLATRRGTEAGKLMVPLLGQRQDMIDEMVMEILSDFGWDCTIESAGPDWITSDTFCAGYANVRWNYRKRSPDSQKRAGIDKKIQDRQNWRKHYALYVISADEAGKKLFNKCGDAYDVMVKYLGLPPGQQKLTRE